MNADAFLDRIAARLGRARRATAAPRDVRGAIERAPIATVDLRAMFVRELTLVGGVVHPVRDRAALREGLAALASDTGARSIVASARAEFAEFELEATLDAMGVACTGDATFAGDAGAVAFRARCAAADIGITAVRAAVAETGSVLLAATPACPRGVSLLPRMHVAIVRESQLVARVGDALALARDPASQMLFVTGPSRTSDIENDLTIGVHGPAAVVVFLLENS
jgi:L-lactate dehydrogenase complex protein LldG